jgi:hypothetical protein
LRFRTRETVAGETPAAAATSRMVVDTHFLTFGRRAGQAIALAATDIR